MRPPMIGELVARYRVLDELGAGGMGVVYRAEDLTLHREVALKVLPSTVSPGAVERFLREARAAAALNHPNICTIYDAGEHDGRPYIAMELLAGQTLKEHLTTGLPSVTYVLELALQIVDGLGAAHAKGIIHRDIKPANISVTGDGRIKVLDFGLAKLVPGLDGRGDSHAVEDTVLDVTQLQGPAVVGTIAYMSPEQARGETLDTRTDLFSFGVVLYEMCTGRRPFGGGTSAVIFNAILSHAPPPFESRTWTLPPELERIVTKALEKDRAHRYQHAADIARDLLRLKRRLELGQIVEEDSSAGAAEARRHDSQRLAEVAGPPGIPASLRDYLRRFPDADVQHRRLRHYVWPAAGIEDPITGEEIATGPAEQLVKTALVADPEAFVLLLGDYGSGKTSFLQSLGRELATDVLTASADTPFPLYLNLGFARSAPDLVDALSAYVARYRVSVSPAEFQDFLASHRNVVLLLDGFDEMAGWVDYKNVPEILERIRRLQSGPGVRLVLSGRSSFFRSDVEVGIVGASHVIRLRPFDDTSMSSYVSSRDPNLTARAGALFDRYPDLRTLCRNPIHLMLFVNWLSTADSGMHQPSTGSGSRRGEPLSPVDIEDLSVVDLYHRFFTKTLQDNFGTLTRWPLNQRLAFVRGVAWHWFNEGIFEWPSQEFSKRIAAEFGELSRDEVDRYTLQLLNCTFFTRVGEHYRFLHQSYLEYLVSQGLADTLLAGDLAMWEAEAPIYTDIYEMIYQMLKRRGLERIDMDWVMNTGTFRTQAKVLTMAWRHHPPAIEPHVRKQMRHNPHDIVRYLASMGLALYTPSEENVESLAAAFDSEQNTVVQALMQRVASNWLAGTVPLALEHTLQSVVNRQVDLRTEDAQRVTLQLGSSKDNANRVLLAFRRAMVQGDSLWPAAVGGMLGLAVVRHQASFSYISKMASEAKHPEIRNAYKAVQTFAGLPELS